MIKLIPPESLPVLHGSRVTLRPITDEDTERIVRWRNTPAVYENVIFREPFTVEMHRNWLRTQVATGRVIQYIILAFDERRPVGSVYFRDIDPRHESAEYGIFIGEECARGIGIGTETAKLFTDFGHSVLRFHRIFLKVLDGNGIAKRSYENAGFVEEGLFRDMVKLDGRFHDVIFMSKLNPEESY